MECKEKHWILKLKQKLIENAESRRKRIKANIRQLDVPMKKKDKLWHKASLRTPYLYEYRSVGNLRVFQRYSQTPLKQVTALEIGAGRYLVAPIGLSLLGLRKIITVDIRRAIPMYVKTVIKYYHKHSKKFGIQNWPKIKGKITDENLDNFLLQNFNIDYRAPYDIGHSDLPDNSIDYIFSNETFEHIDKEILPCIVNESFRILREGGIFYLDIVYEDHRSYKNPEINAYDHYQYTDAEWPQHNLGKLYHNRLLTPDYKKFFLTAGFEIVELKEREVTAEDRAAFATVNVANKFKQKYTAEELMVRKVKFTLRKPFISR